MKYFVSDLYVKQLQKFCGFKKDLPTQGSYGSWKTWKVLVFYFDIFQDRKTLEFYFDIFQNCKVLEKAAGPGKFWKSVKL